MAEVQTVEGYVVDAAVLTQFPSEELPRRARAYGRERLFDVIGGYALVDDDGTITRLDRDAIPLVQEAARRSSVEAGLRLRVVRYPSGGRMITDSVQELGGAVERPQAWDPWKGA